MIRLLRVVPFLFGLCFLGACNAETLDGGSGTGTTSGTNGSKADPISDAPVSGTVGGRSFVPKAVEIQYSTKNAQWFLYFRSYEQDCGHFSGPTPPGGPDAMIVTIGEIAQAAGDTTLAEGDGHAATFQIGVYSDGTMPDVRVATSGLLHLATWDETPGATIGGQIRLVGEGSSIEGTFDAKVCPAGT